MMDQFVCYPTESYPVIAGDSGFSPVSFINHHLLELSSAMLSKPFSSGSVFSQCDRSVAAAPQKRSVRVNQSSRHIHHSAVEVSGFRKLIECLQAQF